MKPQTEHNNKTLKKLLPKAKKCFNLETFEIRGSDELDFYTVSVWNIKEAMLHAYSMGIEDAVEQYLGVIQKLEEENQKLQAQLQEQ